MYRVLAIFPVLLVLWFPSNTWGDSYRATAALNVRSAPGVSARAVFVVPEGSLLQVDQTPRLAQDSHTWVHVQAADGRSGWVAAAYLRPAGGSAPQSSPPSQPAPDRGGATGKVLLLVLVGLTVLWVFSRRFAAPRVRLDCRACTEEAAMKAGTVPRHGGALRFLGYVLGLIGAVGLLFSGSVLWSAAQAVLTVGEASPEASFGALLGLGIVGVPTIFGFLISLIVLALGFALLGTRKVYRCERCGHILERG